MDGVPTTALAAQRFAPAVPHGLSFDVECYYQIVAKDYLGRRIEPTPEVERNTVWLLDLLAKRQVKATFFTLGNVARRFPRLVRRIVEAGHEVGVHGDEHHYLTRMTPAEFRDDLTRAVRSLEDAGGVKIKGHRAPAFSVVRRTLWATDILQSLGIDYDSSIFPLAHRRYGIAGSPRRIHRLPNGLIEVPLTVVDWRGRVLPAGGGGYARLFPYRFTHWAIDQCQREGRPAVTYFHPHEFEPTAPRIPDVGERPSLAARLRLTRFNLLQGRGRGAPMREKLEQLLVDYRFAPLAVLADQARLAA